MAKQRDNMLNLHRNGRVYRTGELQTAGTAGQAEQVNLIQVSADPGYLPSLHKLSAPHIAYSAKRYVLYLK
jgi:hypothetical protein